MPEEKPISRDEIKGLLLLALLFISVIGGREVGNYYASFQEMTELKILFEVSEEELSGYINGVISGEDPELEVGMTITNPAINNTANLVTGTPEYVNRWLIGLTVSPVVVNQPEASDVELEMLIENTEVDQETYVFPKQKISYITFTDRVMKPVIDDVKDFRGAVDDSISIYGGEVKVTFRGRVHMYLLFLDTWLPFEVTRYPIVSAPHLEYIDSGWVSYTQGEVSSVATGEGGYVVVEFMNSMRLHSLGEEITCDMYRVGGSEPVISVTKLVQVAPDSDAQYTFSFNFDDPDEYTYKVYSDDRVLVDSSDVLSVE